MAAVGRFLLIVALVVSPWVFGCVQPWPQFLLAALIGGLTVLRAVQAVIERPPGSMHLPLASVAPLTLLLIAAVQLLPRDSVPTVGMSHAVYSEDAQLFNGLDYVATGTLSPASTRADAARLYFAMAAFLLATQWFADASTHRTLFGVLAMNGVALGAFGIIQRLSWDGRLFWTYELRFGGTPFASFVNRNNAASYLNLCLGAAIGSIILATSQKQSLGRPLSRLKDRIRYAVSRIDGPGLALMGMLTVLVTSVISSLSRGGVVAMVISGSIVAWAAFRRTSRLAVLVMLATVLGVTFGLVKYAGQFDAIDSRLTTLVDPLQAASGRVQHWTDTMGAFRDFPILGTGLGTYRYANLPYQAHPAHAWYYNADNEWFEILVETGVIGFIAVALGMLLIASSAVFLLSQTHTSSRAAGAVGLYVVLSQSIHAVTDFGLIIPSIGITFAVLAGAVCGSACRVAEFERSRIRLSLSLASIESRPGQSLFGICLALAGCAFLLEFFAATSADAARDHGIELRQDETQVGEIDDAIRRAEAVLRFRPDDAELHQAIGGLYADRYRVQMYGNRRNEEPDASGQRLTQLWNATSVAVLAKVARDLEANRGREARMQFLNSDEVRGPVLDNLPQAKHHFQQALMHCSLGRGVAIWLARLSFLDSSATSERNAGFQRQARFTAPSTPSVLIELATLADASHDVEFADECWRRCLEVDPRQCMTVWEAAIQTRTGAEVVDRLLPANVGALVTIAESLTTDESDDTELTREMLVAKAATALEQAGEDIGHFDRARLAELQSQNDVAIEQYRLALADDPWESEAHLRLARLLNRLGRLQEAEVQYSLLPQSLRDRKDIVNERSSLRTRMHERKLDPPLTDAP